MTLILILIHINILESKHSSTAWHPVPMNDFICSFVECADISVLKFLLVLEHSVAVIVAFLCLLCFWCCSMNADQYRMANTRPSRLHIVEVTVDEDGDSMELGLLELDPRGLCFYPMIH